MSSSTPPLSSASVRNILTLLISQDAQLVAGREGLERRITWAVRMRVRLPAFETIRGGELALLGLPQLRRLNETLPHILKSLHTEGAAAVAVTAPSLNALDQEALAIADELHLPLILLSPTTSLEEIEREVITFVVNFRGEIERKATEVFHQLMQLSVQGAGISGVCEQLAQSYDKIVVVQDAEQRIRFQASPTQANTRTLPPILTDETLRRDGLYRITAPIIIRHEIIGYLSLINGNANFGYPERLIIGQVAPIMALEFARERERSEVESRYKAEAFMDILQGNYQQDDEMLARALILGHDLSISQVVVIIELSSSESDHNPGSPEAQWSKRVQAELIRTWPTSWIMSESRRVTALLPLPEDDFPDSGIDRESEDIFFTRIERVHTRLQQTNTLPIYSAGMGRMAKKLSAIPQSFRQAQQALEIGRKLFGNGKLHSFAHLGIYRLLFHLYGQKELDDFYHETLGPLLDSDNRSNSALIDTLEGFFQCNGNLSETARLMHLHRNSLLYRLGRIEELLGRSLEDSELRLALQIALKIRHLQKD